MALKLKAGAEPEAQTEEKPKKKRGRAAQTPEPQVAATEEQKREAMDRLIEADKAVDAAKKTYDSKRSSYRAIYKETKKVTGFTDDQLSWYIKNRDAEPHEIDAEMRGRAEIAAFMNMASGFQASFNFFRNDPEPTNAPEDDVRAAEKQGYLAGGADRPQDNPYPDGGEKEDPRHAAWARGYWRKQNEIAAGLAVKGGNGIAAAHA